MADQVKSRWRCPQTSHILSEHGDEDCYKFSIGQNVFWKIVWNFLQSSSKGGHIPLMKDFVWIQAYEPIWHKWRNLNETLTPVNDNNNGVSLTTLLIKQTQVLKVASSEWALYNKLHCNPIYESPEQKIGSQFGWKMICGLKSLFIILKRFRNSF